MINLNLPQSQLAHSDVWASIWKMISLLKRCTDNCSARRPQFFMFGSLPGLILYDLHDRPDTALMPPNCHIQCLPFPPVFSDHCDRSATPSIGIQPWYPRNSPTEDSHARLPPFSFFPGVRIFCFCFLRKSSLLCPSLLLCFVPNSALLCSRPTRLFCL